MLMSFKPIDFAPAMIANAISAAMNAYSIEVAPHSSPQNLDQNIFTIHSTLRAAFSGFFQLDMANTRAATILKT